MQLKCPYCKHSMSLKTVKPGTFKPTCKGCRKPFLLAIAEDGKSAKIRGLLNKSAAKSGEAAAAKNSPETATKPAAKKSTDSAVEHKAKKPAKPVERPAAKPAKKPVEKSAGSSSAERKAGESGSGQHGAAVKEAEKPTAKKPTTPTVPEYEQTLDGSSHAPAYEQTMDGSSQHGTVAEKPAASAEPEYEQTMDGSSHHGTVADRAAKKPAADRIEQTMIGGAEKTMPAAGSRSNSSMPASANDPEADFLVAKGSETPDYEHTMPSAAGNTVAEKQQAGGSPTQMPESLGGYNLIKELGRGAMGAVYLAKQTSLNRLCALKTVQAKWLSNPVILARFTREAYAAAQLTHHNVVQVYDLGNEGGTNFFSMEYVRGRSLSEVVKEDGKLEAKTAASYALQAARGLRFAHNQGMVHRDVKPGNLMLNEEDIVKVADLGLVKASFVDEDEDPDDMPTDDTPEVDIDDPSSLAMSAELTREGFALGTAAYMAPEQARNSKGVDHRADIYALGCSLFVMLTGKPPYSGATAMEVITKHKTKTIPRADAVVKGLPADLSDIVVKMVAREPADRYQSMDEVIVALEGYLGLQGDGEFKPTDEHAKALRMSVAMFNADKSAKVRSFALMAFVGVTLLLALVSFLIYAKLAFGLLAMIPLTLAIYFVLNGTRTQSVLFDKVRQVFMASSIGDLIVWFTGALLFVLLLFFTAGWLVAPVAILLSAGIAAAIHFVFDAKIKDNRAVAMYKAAGLFRKMRLAGIQEADLRNFVARFGGDKWEGMFEEQFGYDEKMKARAMLAESGEGRSHRKHAAWRDKWIVKLDDKIDRRQSKKQQNTLQKIEQAGLQAQGVSAEDAREQAELMAQTIVDEAEAQRDAILQQAHEKAGVIDPKAAAKAKHERFAAMMAEARSGAKRKEPSVLEKIDGPCNILFGSRVRFVLGCILLGISVYALQKNELLSVKFFEDLWGTIVAKADEAGINKSLLDDLPKESEAEAAKNTATGAAAAGSAAKPTESLVAEPPADVLRILATGIAGIVLLLSSFFYGWKMSVFVIPGALIILFGAVFLHEYIPSALLRYGATVVGGMFVAGLGYLFGQSYKEDY